MLAWIIVAPHQTDHVLKMKGQIEHLERLGAPISQELATDMILASPPSEYDQFLVNFNMHNMEKTITVHKAEKKQYILENPIPDEPESTATKARKDAYISM
ncbi:hypothetical protein OROHE_018616 [Orobanche hederae]